ncbi:MAG: hypothetical protein ACREMP_03300 [Candidatus Tyrphobacter sp.]
MQAHIDERPYVERFDGRERVTMPPLVHHALVGGDMTRILETLAPVGAFDGSDTVFVPDVAYVSQERLRTGYPGANAVQA